MCVTPTTSGAPLRLRRCLSEQQIQVMCDKQELLHAEEQNAHRRRRRSGCSSSGGGAVHSALSLSVNNGAITE